MLLRSLRQLNFRNLVTGEFEPCAGITAITGSNGAGKSNLLEACFLALTGELPGGKIADNVRLGEEQGFVGARVEHDEGISAIEIGLSPGRKSIRLDGQAARVVDISRISTAVLVTPEDAQLVHGSPSHRRGYIDSLLSRISPRYATVLRAYGRILEQRNAALRAGQPGELLGIWSERFVELGSEIEDLRERALKRVSPLATQAYSDVSGGSRELRVSMKRSYEGDLEEALHASAGEERARGVTVVGPHRSDLNLELGGMSAHSFASRGEARTASLALRVAEFRLLEERHGETPVLLLDDFSAELDPSRREFLMGLVGIARQALVTGTETPPRYDTNMTIEAGVLSHG